MSAEYVTHRNLRNNLGTWIRHVEEHGLRVIVWDRKQGRARVELVIAEQPAEPPEDEEVYL